MHNKTVPLLLVLNLLGAVGYLAVASISWTLPAERGLHSTTGEPFIWAMSIWPILALFFLIDLVWAAVILVKRRWRNGRLWLIPLVWLVAISIDFAHH